MMIKALRIASAMIIAAVLAMLGEAAKDVVPVLITVDPGRDTVTALADYVAVFDPRIVGLTGSPEQIAAAARPFMVYYERIGDGPDYSMDHSANTYLLGPDGRWLETFPHGIQATELAQALTVRMSR